MEELYRVIEKKIRESGYPGPVNGKEFYDDVSREAELKENGEYRFIIKKSESLFYYGSMEILDSEFDLHYVDIHENDQKYHVDFDA